MGREQQDLAARIAARINEVKSSQLHAMLEPLEREHRLETVATINGITFINDSKATNINSTWFTLEQIRTPIVLIMGGVDMGNDYSTLHDLVMQKVTQLVLLGDHDRIEEWFRLHPIEMRAVSSMSDAVITAFALAKKGDTVLLSPACASFDLFENYEDRGRQFKEAIRKL